MKVKVVPRSQRALGILRKRLGGCAIVEVFRNVDGKLLLVSPTGNFSFWVDMRTSRDWHVLFHFTEAK
jgi:hypothetical protein